MKFILTLLKNTARRPILAVVFASLTTTSGTVSQALALLLAASQMGQPLHGADVYWDSDADPTGNSTLGANLGGVGTWDDPITANWWDGVSGVNQP